ncbi:DUF805 domain-containing protein [Aurantiacibacter aquimixticola]|uniref:DUF805 domain-containing protein n=1 Tax=Aurantiacibacter aquimixticola TaxID=1958945 RepID=A0A419RS34_9SPHN|nr:DUF805 domain-containing protein [Aurantiacibacter aquimixticola]RJY08587.1 DUF805 domain-containing protein [Aurantiacibacter aquimixticola]
MTDEADLSVRRGCMADFSTLPRAIRLLCEPRGRSTRTELALIVLVANLIAIITVLPASFVLPIAWEDRIWFGLYSCVALVLPAAAARRFHDMAKTGWLALPLVALLAIGLWDAWLDVTQVSFAASDLFYNEPMLEFLFNVTCLGYVVALMLPPRDPGNPYGPNPRPPEKTI